MSGSHTGPAVGGAWVRWAMELQTIADAGLEFAADDFDRERYEQVRRITAELIGHHLTDGDRVTVEELFPVGHGYPTPKVDVRALVIDKEGRVLCVRNRDRGRWSLPGGFADLGESPMESAVREVHEETGYEVRPGRLLALMEADRHRERALRWSFWQVLVACEVTGGAPRASIETIEVDWFDPDGLPDLDQRSPETVVRLGLTALETGGTHCD